MLKNLSSDMGMGAFHARTSLSEDTCYNYPVVRFALSLPGHGRFCYLVYSKLFMLQKQTNLFTVRFIYNPFKVSVFIHNVEVIGDIISFLLEFDIRLENDTEKSILFVFISASFFKNRKLWCRFARFHIGALSLI